LGILWVNQHNKEMELMPYIRDRVIKGNNTTNVDYIVEAHDAYKYYINR